MKFLLTLLKRTEGNISLIQDSSFKEKPFYVGSDRPVGIVQALQGKYPLDAIHLTQQLSSLSGIAHGIASCLAIEDLLHIRPTDSGQNIRKILLQISTIYAHIYHFYWRYLPDFINLGHIKNLPELNPNFKRFLSRAPEKGDLSLEIGSKIVEHYAEAEKVIAKLQKLIASFGGKFPVIMNLIPGGVGNHKIRKSQLIDVIFQLRSIKEFIEITWPNDVKSFIKALPYTHRTYIKNSNLVSFGSLSTKIHQKQNSYHSPGVFIEGKLEPLDENKFTFTNPLKLPNWVKPIRYDTVSLYSGVLPRMIVNYYAGGNRELIDALTQILQDLNLTLDQLNCAATRILSKVFESRYFLKDTLNTLLDFNHDSKLTNSISYSFPRSSEGVGKIEGPLGSIYHKLKLKNGFIESYQILTPTNWNLSPQDELGRLSVVEEELNLVHNKKPIDMITASRIMHSFDIQGLEAIQ